MFPRRFGAAIIVLAVIGTLTGCLADYADGSLCTAANQDVSAVLADELGITSDLDNTGLYPAGVSPDNAEDPTWCVLSLDTRLDLAQSDTGRQAAKASIANIVRELQPGAFVTITYASVDGEQYKADRQDSFISPSTSTD